MLYTFSKSDYSEQELTNYFKQVKSDDYVLFWQDGVLIPIKYPFLLTLLIAKTGILKKDFEARNLTSLSKSKLNNIEFITLDELVDITVKYFPQMDL